MIDTVRFNQTAIRVRGISNNKMRLQTFHLADLGRRRKGVGGRA